MALDARLGSAYSNADKPPFHIEQARSVLQSHEDWRQRHPVSRVASSTILDRKADDPNVKDGTTSFSGEISMYGSDRMQGSFARRIPGNSLLAQPSKSHDDGHLGSSTSRPFSQLHGSDSSSREARALAVGQSSLATTGHDTRVKDWAASFRQSSSRDAANQQDAYQSTPYGSSTHPGHSTSSTNHLFPERFFSESSVREERSTYLGNTSAVDTGVEDLLASLRRSALPDVAELQKVRNVPQRSTWDHQSSISAVGAHTDHSASSASRPREGSFRESCATHPSMTAVRSSGADDFPAAIRLAQNGTDLQKPNAFPQRLPWSFHSGQSDSGANLGGDRVRDLAAEMHKAALQDRGLEHMWNNLEDRATKLATSSCSRHDQDISQLSEGRPHANKLGADTSKMLLADSDRQASPRPSSGSEQVQAGSSSRPQNATVLAEVAESSFERRLHAMEDQLHLLGVMSRKSQESCEEATELRSELLQVETSQRVCLEEREAMGEACAQHAHECRELQQRLVASHAAARESGDAHHWEVKKHQEMIHSCEAELAEAQQQLVAKFDAEHAAQRTLACSLVLAERQLLAALHGSPRHPDRQIAPHLSKEVEATVARLHKAASDIAIGAWENPGDSSQIGPCEVVAAAAVEQLSALAAHAIRSHHDPPERFHSVIEAFAKLLGLGRTLARATSAVLKRLQRLGAHIAAGRLVRCSKAGELGKAMCVIWAGEWVPFNTELPNGEHAVAAWQQGAVDAQSALEKFQTGRASIDHSRTDFVMTSGLAQMEPVSVGVTAAYDV